MYLVTSISIQSLGIERGRPWCPRIPDIPSIGRIRGLAESLQPCILANRRRRKRRTKGYSFIQRSIFPKIDASASVPNKITIIFLTNCHAVLGSGPSVGVPRMIRRATIAASRQLHSIPKYTSTSIRQLGSVAPRCSIPKPSSRAFYPFLQTANMVCNLDLQSYLSQWSMGLRALS